MVTPRVEKGTDRLRREMAERASVMDKCAPLERRRMQGVTYGPAMVARSEPRAICPFLNQLLYRSTQAEIRS